MRQKPPDRSRLILGAVILLLSAVGAGVLKHSRTQQIVAKYDAQLRDAPDYDVCKALGSGSWNKEKAAAAIAEQRGLKCD